MSNLYGDAVLIVDPQHTADRSTNEENSKGQVTAEGAKICAMLPEGFPFHQFNFIYYS